MLNERFHDQHANANVEDALKEFVTSSPNQHLREAAVSGLAIMVMVQNMADMFKRLGTDTANVVYLACRDIREEDLGARTVENLNIYTLKMTVENVKKFVKAERFIILRLMRFIFRVPALGKVQMHRDRLTEALAQCGVLTGIRMHEENITPAGSSYRLLSEGTPSRCQARMHILSPATTTEPQTFLCPDATMRGSAMAIEIVTDNNMAYTMGNISTTTISRSVTVSVRSHGHR